MYLVFLILSCSGSNKSVNHKLNDLASSTKVRGNMETKYEDTRQDIESKENKETVIYNNTEKVVVKEKSADSKEDIEFKEIEDINHKLLYACEIGSLDKVKFAIKGGADINYISYSTPLNIAIINSHFGLIDYLLANKADVDLIGDEYSALHLAAGIDNKELLAKMLVMSRDINKKSKEDKETALQIAVINNLLDNVRIILKTEKADLHSQNCKGQDALIQALVMSHSISDISILKELLKHSPSLETEDKYNMSVKKYLALLECRQNSSSDEDKLSPHEEQIVELFN